MKRALASLMVLVTTSACPDEPNSADDGETTTDDESTSGDGDGDGDPGDGDPGDGDPGDGDPGDGDPGDGDGDGDPGDGDGDEPGACLDEVDDPQLDEFVGDQVADMDLKLRTVVAEPPVELFVGARVHVKGSYIDCCDDDIVVPESVVVRTYPAERFILGQVASLSTPPNPSASFFAAIGEDLETWLAPFTLSSHDDMICDDYVWDEIQATRKRTRLHVDAGTCETAKIIDEETGYFGDVFFVTANDMTLWEPSGGTVDSISYGDVFISRQPCEGECPATADVLDCPVDDQWPQDSAEIEFFGYCYKPSDSGYDQICEILSEDDDGEIVTYALDCGPIPFDCNE